MLILIMPLSASLTFPEDISPELRQRLEKALDKAVGDRNALDITLSGVKEESGVIRMNVSWSGRSEDIAVPAEYIEDELESLFYYEDELFEEGERLDYIYSTSFSSTTLSSASRGQNYCVVGESGRSEALLIVSSVYDNGVIFTPVYLSSPLPGMRIERVNDFTLRLRVFSDFSFSSIGSSLSVYYSSIIYPVIPFLEASVITTGGKDVSSGAFLGFRCDFALSSVWSDVPVVKNLSLSGEASIGAAVNGMKIALSASYAFETTYTFSRIFSLSLGLRNYDGTNYLCVALGGKL